MYCVCHTHDCNENQNVSSNCSHTTIQVFSLTTDLHAASFHRSIHHWYPRRQLKNIIRTIVQVCSIYSRSTSYMTWWRQQQQNKSSRPPRKIWSGSGVRIWIRTLDCFQNLTAKWWKNTLSRNVEESFKKFLDLDPDLEANDFLNLISSSLCTDTSVVKFLWRSAR